MLDLYFSGWFQCRLATDPDPPEETRGVSGFTFALAGEPDLDRVIRFHDPVAPRSHAPPIGVTVYRVCVADRPVARHPLLHARLELLGEPKFESRNYILRESSQGPIVPFHLRVAGGDITIEREDILFPQKPDVPLHEIPLEHLARRGSTVPLTVDRVRIANATGIADPLTYRQRRKDLLTTDLRATRDPVIRAALEKRVAELAITDPNKLQVWSLLVYNDFRFQMNGPARVTDPQSRLEVEIEPRADWPIIFWMGAWDSDALSGYTEGILSIPLTNERAEQQNRQQREEPRS